MDRDNHQNININHLFIDQNNEANDRCFDKHLNLDHIKYYQWDRNLNQNLKEINFCFHFHLNENINKYQLK